MLALMASSACLAHKLVGQAFLGCWMGAGFMALADLYIYAAGLCNSHRPPRE